MMEKRAQIIKIAYRIVLAAVLVGALRIASGKAKLIFAVFGIAALAATFLWNKFSAACKRYILLGAGVVFIILNIYYNAVYFQQMLPLRYTTDQHIHQLEDEEYGTMSDAYLRELIRNKEVLIPYEVQPYIVYNPVEDEDERGSEFNARYYFENNFARYFIEYAGNCNVDKTLVGIDDAAETVAAIKSDFTDIGSCNDLLRYTFMLNQEDSKETKYFWYSWYYRVFAEDENHYPHIYIDKASSTAAKKLVAIWDKDENLYVMGIDKYEEVRK